VAELWLVPGAPFAGFVLLTLGALRLPRRAVATIGSGSIAVALGASAFAAAKLLGGGATLESGSWPWFALSGLSAGFGLRFDALAMVMSLTVSFVALLIHLYSIDYMSSDPSYARFFALMNFFVAAMLVLVLASDLLWLYVGWEGVGLASYLLIGFWYSEPANVRAAEKAFLITRIGDAAMLLGIILAGFELGTLDLQALATRAGDGPARASAMAAPALLLLCGALGKSAQLPLQTWLPDAMVGPTPVSALIHAATMVTAGVYLIARLHALFELAPLVQALVAAIGAVTLFFAGASALVQRDLKRILAYSTMSQVGYMFLALGVGAWPAAIFHVVTHAFGKGLLFLSAGVVIVAAHHQQDVLRLGGMAKRTPLAFAGFLVGSASISGIPLITAGFYSKEQIMSSAWAGRGGSPWLWLVAILGALLTALYTFRALFLVFLGPEPTDPPPDRRSSAAIAVPLVLLAAGAIGAGLLGPELSSAFDVARIEAAGGIATALDIAAALTPLLGVGLAWVLYRRGALAFAEPKSAALSVAAEGFGFDFVYAKLFSEPYQRLARALKSDVLDEPWDALARAATAAHRALADTQNGRLATYLAATAAGLVLLLLAVGVE
jgi:NADH-quinone oxidoreductase subunit L